MKAEKPLLWRAVAQQLFEEALFRDGAPGRVFFPSEADIPDDLWLAALTLQLAEVMDLDESVAWVTNAWQQLIELRAEGLEPADIADFILEKTQPSRPEQ